MPYSELIRIFRKLEANRDIALEKFLRDDIVDGFFLMQINIFPSTLFFVSADLGLEIDDLSKAYITYYKSKHNAVLYLLELYLTTAHVAVMDQASRHSFVYSLAVGEKIHLHKMDIWVHELLNNEDTKNKLNQNRLEYKDFINKFGKISEKIPEEIEGFFIGRNIKNNFEQEFGFKLIKHSKIDYTNEIRINPLIPDFRRDHLLLAYPMLSSEIHPTLSSLIDFELFIQKPTLESKKVFLRRRMGLVEVLSKVIGEQMDKLTEKLILEKYE